jgi:predicted membrane metal-binding protein
VLIPVTILLLLLLMLHLLLPHHELLAQSFQLFLAGVNGTLLYCDHNGVHQSYLEPFDFIL